LKFYHRENLPKAGKQAVGNGHARSSIGSGMPEPYNRMLII